VCTNERILLSETSPLTVNYHVSDIRHADRRSLHFHAVIWAGLTPTTFQRIAHDDKLAELASNNIDACVCGCIESKLQDAADCTSRYRSKMRMGDRKLKPDEPLEISQRDKKHDMCDCMLGLIKAIECRGKGLAAEINMVRHG
jgi:hypothetical protein